MHEILEIQIQISNLYTQNNIFLTSMKNVVLFCILRVEIRGVINGFKGPLSRHNTSILQPGNGHIIPLGQEHSCPVVRHINSIPYLLQEIRVYLE